VALLLNPRAWLALVLAGFLAFTHFSAYRAGKAAVRADFDAYKLAVQQQAETMREARAQSARDAAQKETVRTVTRTVYITKKAKEIDHDAQALSACPMPARTVGVLNDIARCAREDRPASCKPDDAVPGAR
jgi:hypothetical protein